ncbi:MAG: sigma-54-dependent transcriptional regulator [Myxococcota bacterium]
MALSVAQKESNPARVLLIDDDEATCGLLSKYLQHHGHTVDVMHDGGGIGRALSNPVDVVLLDVNLPGTHGYSLLDRIGRERPDLSVVILTAVAGIENVVESMRRGAFDYLTKPIDFQRLSIVVRNAMQTTRLRLETDGLKAAMLRNDGGPDLICASQAMSEVISLVERVAATKVPVLIQGEPGAGKEIVARRVHARSRHRTGPFVSMNCTALPGEVLEHELFGVEGGKPGKIQEAEGGTLFLGEVSELDLELQGRLLRAMQEHDRDRARSGIDASSPRIIAATSTHLPSEVSRGTFRADLFYRLNVFSIVVPPLRDRREDIPALARYAIARFASRESTPPPTLTEGALDLMRAYAWPGNVRELYSVVERAALMCSGALIQADDLPNSLRENTAPVEVRAERTLTLVSDEGDPSGKGVRPLQELEREMMVAALTETQGNVSEAARRLGIGRATFYRRAQRYGLTREDGFPG